MPDRRRKTGRPDVRRGDWGLRITEGRKSDGGPGIGDRKEEVRKLEARSKKLEVRLRGDGHTYPFRSCQKNNRPETEDEAGLLSGNKSIRLLY